MRRSRRYTLEHVAKLFAIFGVDLIANLDRCTTPDAMTEAFKASRDDAKRRYREMALALHPDRGGSEEQLKEVTALWNIIKTLEIRPHVKRPRAPPATSVFVGVSTPDTGAYGAQTQGTGSMHSQTRGYGGSVGFRWQPIAHFNLDDI